MELNEDVVQVSPVTIVYIEPYTAHRLYSAAGVGTIVFGMPALDPEDEYIDVRGEGGPTIEFLAPHLTSLVPRDQYHCGVTSHCKAPWPLPGRSPQVTRATPALASSICIFLLPSSQATNSLRSGLWPIRPTLSPPCFSR